MAPAPDHPVAVFDSGVGGLTVLHELLVSLPAEDYIYLGDTARFPYGDRSRQELRSFSIEIAEHLLQEGAKLLVVACNSASAAGLGALERHLAESGREIDVIGVVAPATQLAVAGSHSGRIGLLATPATVDSGAYETCRARRRPSRPSRKRGLRRPGDDHRTGLSVRRARGRDRAQVLRPAAGCEVDTVMLGCTHYPLVAPMLRRMLGRGVSLVSAGAGVARSAERALAARGLLNPCEQEGAYRFECTADAESFKTLGTRFLQMPLREVLHVELAERIAA